MGQKSSTPEVKTCSECKEALELSSYYKYELKKDNPACKKCVKARRRAPEAPGDSKTLNYKITGVYMISTVEKMQEDLYKIGKHTGSQRKLLSRYRTYLIDPVILFYYPTANMDKLEKHILKEVQDFRISDMDSGDTEWVKMERSKLIAILNECCANI